MAIQFKRLRATLMWAWAGEELVAGPGRDWWAADRARYVGVFDTLRAGTAAPPWPLSLPWAGGRRQRFFSSLVGEAGQALGHQRDITGSQAFRHLVPLRATGLVPGLALADGTRVALEAMLSPVGVGLLLNLDLRGDWAAEAMADHWLAILRDPVFTTTAGAPLRASQVRDAARQALQQHWGLPPVAQPIGNDEPYTVVTALEVDGAAAVPPEGPAPDLQRVLYALASGLKDWRQLAVPAWWSRTTAPSTRHAQGRACLSAPQRGLLVWHPDAIVPGAPARATGALNCYHRNLVLALLHTQCAMRHLRLCRTLRDGPGLGAQASDVMRRAVVTLSRLNGRSGYQTGAVPRWLAEDTDALAVIDDERQRGGLPPLAQAGP